MQVVLTWLLAHHKLIDYGTRTIAICSVLHSVLPPWDWNPPFVSEGLAEFPTAQKIFRGTLNNRYYRFLIYAIGYIALNARSTIWRFISVSNPKGPNSKTNGAPPTSS